MLFLTNDCDQRLHLRYGGRDLQKDGSQRGFSCIVEYVSIKNAASISRELTGQRRNRVSE